MKYLFFNVALIAISSYQLKKVSADCPSGYELKYGDIPGWGQVGKNPSFEKKISDCSERCDNQEECCSFEYSPTRKRCNLNRFVNFLFKISPLDGNH